eukprot:GEMP01070857.1.p3 GENE.GEMP01070857.1~~GEMP01070857.1.p3  ORF type:complete len:317 (+),score=94.35 GEMP01070857.1:175-1125(+)
MPSAEKLAKKQVYFDKLIRLLETEPTCLLVNVDHVGSKQLQNIRIILRGKATILMGKNTMIRTALRKRFEETGDEGLERLISVMKGNLGFIFCKAGTVDFVRDVMDKNVLPAAAKVGVEAPVDVHIPAGPCGLDPAQTSFFQALNIATKIVKGAIEIVNDTHLLKTGDQCGASAVALLQKLGIKPFEYGMSLKMVYEEGSVFDAKVLDITDDVLTSKFMVGVQNVAAFGREIGIPTEAGLPHMVGNAFKNIAALVSDIDFTFKEVEIVKEFLADPSKFAAAAATASPAAGGAAPAAAVAAPVEEEEEEDMEFDLFG